ncbi:MAG: esterase-like activity of phytase family protein [Myxococcales bacterium]
MRKSFERATAALAIGGSLTIGGCGAQSGTESGDDVSPQLVSSHVEALSTGPQLIATGTLDLATDLSPVVAPLENGLPQNVLGGIGSALAFAGGTTFLGLPDRGPNATPYTNGTPLDNTSSFIPRLETLSLKLSPATSGSLPFSLAAELKATTLLYSASPLVYGNTPGVGDGTPAANTAGKFYFTGRSDNFGPGLSTTPDFARLDPEGLVISNDGNSVFVADEYGPYVYQFDRLTGERLRSFALPSYFAIPNLSALGAAEISGNTIGRVTNKGMEGLAITPDGSTLVALVQSPLIQDGGDGARPNRIVTIDIASGATHEYVYDNQITIGTSSKAYNSSEIIALNNHQFLIDTRDGKGLGDGSNAVVKQLWAVDIAGATDVSGMSGQATLLNYAVKKVLFLDIVASLKTYGTSVAQIPAKIEGLAFGPDVLLNDVVTHTLYVANDNDFLPNVAGPNRWYVFGFTDEDLAAKNLSYVRQPVTERGPDLTLNQSASASSVVTGSQVTFTLTATNTGILSASAVTLSNALPSQLLPLGCTATGGTCQAGSSPVTFSYDTLAGDASVTATLSAKLDCAVSNGTQLTSKATASSSITDPTPEDDSASVTITAVNPSPSIAGVGVSQALLWPPNNKLVPISVAYSVSDNCPGTVCSLSVTSDQPNSVHGPDSAVVDGHNVLLRATRTGGADRTYTIGISCQDSGGSVSLGSATVSVGK